MATRARGISKSSYGREELKEKMAESPGKGASVEDLRTWAVSMFGRVNESLMRLGARAELDSGRIDQMWPHGPRLDEQKASITKLEGIVDEMARVGVTETRLAAAIQGTQEADAQRVQTLRTELSAFADKLAASTQHIKKV